MAERLLERRRAAAHAAIRVVPRFVQSSQKSKDLWGVFSAIHSAGKPSPAGPTIQRIGVTT